MSSLNTLRPRPLCPICENPLLTWQQVDMHEALITKNHVRSQALGWLINSPYNCVLRHHGIKQCKHEAGTGGDEIFHACAIMLVTQHGPPKIEEYLIEMSKLFPTLEEIALKRFQTLFINPRRAALENH